AVRSSGVMTEALAAGKTVLVRRDTWMSRQLEPERGRDFDDMDEAVAAMKEIIANFANFESAAREFKHIWRKRHSPAALVAALLDSHSRVAGLPTAQAARKLARNPMVVVLVVLEFFM